MLRVLIVFACTALSACSQTSSPPIGATPSEIADVLLSNISYSAVTKLDFKDANQELVYGVDPLQKGLLWLPDGASSQNPAPLVIFIHGGCWLNSYDIKHSKGVTSALADQGYAVWSLEYRRTGDEGGGWPGSFEDVVKGIDHILTLDMASIDRSRTVLTGHSAGGHLALLAGKSFPQLLGVIGLASIVDIEAYAMGANSCQKATQGFMNGSVSQQPDAYFAANPKQQTLHVNSQLLAGDADTIVPILQATQSAFRYTIVNGAGHFDWLHPQSVAFRTFLDKLPETRN